MSTITPAPAVTPDADVAHVAWLLVSGGFPSADVRAWSRSYPSLVPLGEAMEAAELQALAGSPLVPS